MPTPSKRSAVRDAEPPVFRSGRDDDRARGDRGAVVELDAQRLLLAMKLGGALGDDHMRAELLRLGVGPAGQLLARDAGREAEVVFDLRARAGLPAGRVRLEHEDIEPFGCGVDGRRQAGRPRADDDDVAQLLLVDGLVEAEAACQLTIRGVLVDRTAVADRHGHLVRLNAEAIEQGFRVRIALEIEIGVWMTVACEELLDAQRVRRVRRAHDDHVAGLMGDQLDAAQDKRPHEDIAEFAVRLQERAQPGTVELNDLAIF